MPSEQKQGTAQVVLVTGASSDIGMALVRALLTASATATVLAHSFSGGARIQALVEEFGPRVVPFQADFADAASVRAMADAIAASYIPTAVVHLPALRLQYERFTKLKWDRFQTDMAVQLESAVILLQRFLPNMAKLPGARVVFVLSSVTLGMPPKFMSLYTVVKYAQLGLMRALAAEYAASSVRVNAVSPGMVETQFLLELPPVAVEMSGAGNPQGRNATPTDVVGAIVFLLSPAAEYMTGVDMPLTGGSTR